MSYKYILNNLQFRWVCLIAFTLPLPIKLNAIAIFLSMSAWVLKGNYKIELTHVIKTQYVLWLWSFFALYIIHAFFSVNTPEGFAIVERRASLFFLPIVLVGRLYARAELKSILFSFIAGVLFSFLICIIQAFYIYTQQRDVGVFFYQELSKIVGGGAVYLACYCVIAIHCVLFYFKEINKFLAVVLLVLLVTFCILLNSKLMLALLLLSFIVTIWLNFKSKIRYVLLASALVAAMLCLFIPAIKQRVVVELSARLSVVEQSTYQYDTPFSGTSLRLVLWKFSFQLLNEKKAWLTGVHTGDFQDLLNTKYKTTGLYTGNPELKDTGYLGYGPHNQYIEILLSMGISGLIVFLGLLFYASKSIFRNGNYLAYATLIIFCLFFITESVLSMQRGIVAFVFFTLLFNNLQFQNSEGYQK